MTSRTMLRFFFGVMALIVGCAASVWCMAEGAPAVESAPPAADVAPAPAAADVEKPAEAVAEKPAETTPETPAPPAEEQIAIAFKDVQMEQICKFIGEKRGKPVIPHESIKGKKITIIHDKTVPLGVGLEVIANALRQNGVIIQEYPLHIEFLPIEQARRTPRPVVGPDETVADFKDQSQMVDKVFLIRHHDVQKLPGIVSQVLPEYGFVVADPNVKKLIVTATAADLRRVEELIERLDVPMADLATTRVFKLRNGDASDLVGILRTLTNASAGRQSQPMTTSGPEPRPEGAVTVAAGSSPVTLMAEVTRNWIIAVAPPSTMTLIENWVKELDQPTDEEQPFDVVDIKHADIAAVANQINQAIASHPNEDVKKDLKVVPFDQTRKLFVFGSQSGRAFVLALLERLDVEVHDLYGMEEFVLRDADAEKVAERIETLFANRELQYQGRGWGGNFQQYRSAGPQAVKVTADTYRNSVTVFTDPGRMAKIRHLIAEWDKPLATEDVQPKVYVLKYADPLKVKEILDSMFAQVTAAQRPWWMEPAPEKSPIGRLYGQFSFEAMEDSNTLIVTTKSSANYEVIDRLIEQLDQPQAAGLPMVVELKHSNAEDLAEQLNAMFADRGQRAAIMRAERGLTRYAMIQETEENQQQNQGGPQQQQQQERAGEMLFPWSQGSQPLDERKTSNLIGRPRFVPVHRRNALMVLAPPAYEPVLKDMIELLDQPGRQVVIHAIVAEIRHDNTTTVGVRFASDPAILNDLRLADQSIGGSAEVVYTDMFSNDRGILRVGADLNFLIQLLDKHFGLNIMLEPKLYTADNQEALIFDGQDVPYQSESQTTDAGQTNRSFTYRAVGTALSVRPQITPKGDVDLMINLEVSNVVPGDAVEGNPVFDRRETNTHVVLQNGQTVVLSGIVRKERFLENRKVPLLGDIPLAGELFKSKDEQERNRELLVFLTPRVVWEAKDAESVMQQEREMLERIRALMGDTEDGARTPPPMTEEELEAEEEQAP